MCRSSGEQRTFIFSRLNNKTSMFCIVVLFISYFLSTTVKNSAVRANFAKIAFMWHSRKSISWRAFMEYCLPLQTSWSQSLAGKCTMLYASKVATHRAPSRPAPPQRPAVENMHRLYWYRYDIEESSERHLQIRILICWIKIVWICAFE